MFTSNNNQKFVVVFKFSQSEHGHKNSIFWLAEFKKKYQLMQHCTFLID
jgi:hypothetical protein